MIYTVETKDQQFRIFCYEGFGPTQFSDEFKAWYDSQGLRFMALSRNLSEIPLTLHPTTFSFTDDMHTIADNELITNTFYFGDPEVAMLFRLTWS